VKVRVKPQPRENSGDRSCRSCRTFVVGIIAR
jgi:hypothetical protein